MLVLLNQGKRHNKLHKLIYALFLIAQRRVESPVTEFI